jgi:hypothetical protein
VNVKIITNILNTKKFYFHLYKIIHKVKHYYLDIKTIGIYISLVYIFIYKPNYVNQTNKNTLVNFQLLTKLNYICLLNQT